MKHLYYILLLLFILFTNTQCSIFNKSSSSEAEKYYSKGRKAYSDVNINGAIVNFLKAVELDSTQYLYYKYLSQCYEEKGNRLKEKQFLEKAIMLNPDIVSGEPLKVMQIPLAYYNGDLKEDADSFFDKLEYSSLYKKKFPAEFYTAKGIYFRKTDRPIIADSCFTLALKEDPTYALAREYRVYNATNELGENIKGLRDIEEIIEHISKNGTNADYSIYRQYTLVLINLGRYEEAWNALNYLEERGMLKKDLIYSFRSYIKMNQHCLEEALDLCDKAIKENPQDINFYFHRSQLHFQMNDIKASVDDCDKGIRTSSGGKRERALKSLKARWMYRIDPAEAAKIVDECFLNDETEKDNAFAWYIKGNYRKAEELIQEEISKPSKTAEDYYSIACYYSMTNNTEKALEYLGMAMDAGYDSYGWVISDADFFNLHQNERFIYLTEKLCEKNRSILLKPILK